ncbi:AAA family ATPase [Micromonospora sp. NPDC050495]|uniref:ATP-binding protein n=1 Tax=Micromonospora sp. NPDC050495 TaxID=3154936 RepID=UPI0033F272F1
MGELAALTAAVSAPPSVVTVVGEAGVGKTRLVSELLRLPEVTGRRVLVGRCHPVREAFPLGPVVEALAGVGDDGRGLRLSEVAGALRPLLPELAPWLPPAPEPLEDRASQRHRVFRGLIDVLGALSPAVLVIEDLHWVDEQTSDFLAYLLAAAPPGLTAVLTYRNEQANNVRAVPATLPAGTTRAHVALAPLDEAGTGALAAAILGTDGVSQEFARHLWECTAGLPFAVEEVIALVRERGLLVQRGDRWARRTLDRLEVPRGIRESTLERVLRLSAGARRVAEAAAVLQAPVGLPVLAAMVGGEGLVEALEEAVGHSVLVEEGDAFGFRHALAAQAVYESLGAARRGALHGRAAAALDGLSSPPLGRIAHHLWHAGELARWAVTAEAAADQAVTLTDDAEAVRHLAAVLRHAPLDARQRGRVAVKLGWAAIRALRVDDALELLPTVIGEDLSPPVRGELRLLMAQLLDETGGDPHVKRRLFVEAVADLDGRPDLQARTMMALGVPTSPGVPMAEHLTWVSRSLKLAVEAGDRLVEAHILGKAGMVLIPAGDPSWRELTDRLLRITGSSPRHPCEANAYLSIGFVAGYTGHLDTAESLLATGLRSAVTRESQRLENGFRSAQACLAFHRGQWVGLVEEVDRLIGELSEHPRLRIDLDIVAGCLALAHGAVDLARRRLTDAIDLAEQLYDLPVLPLAVDAVVRAALFRGGVGEAVVSVRRCRSLLTAKGNWAPLARLLPAAAEALVAAGERAEADDLVRQVTKELRDLDVPLLPAGLHHAHGILAADADELLVAAEEYRRVGAGYEEIRARERAAGLLLEAGHERGAPLLREAVAGYEALGATWDLNRALGLARRHVVGLPARHRGGRRGYGGTLSPRERQVAELAATGRTNKEIAEALVLSATTVEKHLGAAMRKLNIRSRTELARLMATSTSKDGGFPS